MVLYSLVVDVHNERNVGQKGVTNRGGMSRNLGDLDNPGANGKAYVRTLPSFESTDSRRVHGPRDNPCIMYTQSQRGTIHVGTPMRLVKSIPLV